MVLAGAHPTATPEETRGPGLALLQGGAGPADGLLLEAVQDEFTQ